LPSLVLPLRRSQLKHALDDALSDDSNRHNPRVPQPPVGVGETEYVLEYRCK
jgi:hypothetical protein